MAAAASASAARSPAGAAAPDLEDSNVSSPLSEVGDGDANDDEIEHMQLDSRGDDASVTSDVERLDAHNDGSDSDSALSDAASDVNSDANDTEAETERLYDTPRNQRQRDVVVDQFNNGQIFEHTPSKLRRTTRATHRDEDGAENDGDDANGGNRDGGFASGDDASVVSSRARGDESPAKPTTANDAGVGDMAKHDTQERKRKRSPLAGQSESDQPLRKRNGSVAAPAGDADGDTPMNDEDTTSANPQSGHQSGGEDEGSGTASLRDTTAEAPERETRASKKSTRSSLKRQGLAPVEDTNGEAESDIRDEHEDATAEDETEQPEEEPDVDADEEADAAARNIEESV